jgi:UDP-glucose 4-epimerase
MNINIEGLKLVLDTAFKYNKKVIFSSTSEIYGKNLKVPWSEDDDRVLGPTSKQRWCYSSSKAVGEHMCFAYRDLGLKVAICRFFNFYGPKLDFLGRGRVLPVFLGQFLKNEPVTVVEPGDQTRCFTYISDGVDGILKVAHAKEAEGQVFNIGTEEETSVLELAKKIKSIGNFSSEIVMVPAEEIYGKGYEDIFRRVPNISKARKVLSWEPKVSIDDGLRKTIRWYKDNKQQQWLRM